MFGEFIHDSYFYRSRTPLEFVGVPDNQRPPYDVDRYGRFGGVFCFGNQKAFHDSRIVAADW